MPRSREEHARKHEVSVELTNLRSKKLARGVIPKASLLVRRPRD